jgi:hypothetical protein
MEGMFKCRQCGKEFMRNDVWDPIDCEDCLAKMGEEFNRIMNSIKEKKYEKEKGKRKSIHYGNAGATCI